MGKEDYWRKNFRGMDDRRDIDGNLREKELFRTEIFLIKF
jgi:hypothetical protein